MNKLPKIILLLLVFIVLTTYNPNQFSVLPKNFFFKIKNIEITSNVLIETKNIEEKISQIYGTNINKGVIFFSILISMRYSNFNIISF